MRNGTLKKNKRRRRNKTMTTMDVFVDRVTIVARAV